MKKSSLFLVLALLLASTLLLPGCASGGAYQAYAGLIESMKGKISVDMDYEIYSYALDNYVVDDDGYAEMEDERSGNFKLIQKSDDEIEMAFDMTYKSIEAEWGTEQGRINGYYKGGYFYAKFKSMTESKLESNSLNMGKEDPDEILQAYRPFDITAFDFDKSAVLKSETAKVTNANALFGTEYSFELDAGQAKAVLEKSLGEISTEIIGLHGVEFGVGDVIKFGIVVDKNVLKSVCISYDIKGREEYRNEVNITYDSFDDVTIEFPSDLEDWEDINLGDF